MFELPGKVVLGKEEMLDSLALFIIDLISLKNFPVKSRVCIRNPVKDTTEGRKHLLLSPRIIIPPK